MNNIVGLSKIGLVRKQNEDRFFISDNICAVTDGMDRGRVYRIMQKPVPVNPILHP